MQLASELTQGGMATVIYNHQSKLKEALNKAKEWCLDRGIDKPECQIATYLNPNMKIISGHLEVSIQIIKQKVEINSEFFLIENHPANK